jgi:signal transduction histidine kinase
VGLNILLMTHPRTDALVGAVSHDLGTPLATIKVTSSTLPVAKTVIQAHREHIWVEDPPGEGARFVFTLPFARNYGSKR